MSFKKIGVAGGGVLGSQIAYQSAYCGFNVTLWLRSEASVGRAASKIEKLHTMYAQAVALMETSSNPSDFCRGLADEGEFDAAACREKNDAAFASIKYETDMAKAFADADLVIESVAENVPDKRAFYEKLAPLLPEKTVIVTNSSTLLPSQFAQYTGRPEKFLSLHFANHIWKNNTAEVMVHPGTDMKYFDRVFAFAGEIRMLPLPVLKEKNGYLLNSMLVPFLLSGLDLYVNGISDPASIDKAWTRGTGAPRGPFEIFDVVGINTAYNIVTQYRKVPGLMSPLLRKMMMPYNFKGMEAALKKMIDKGKLGRAAGEGFYKYK